MTTTTTMTEPIAYTLPLAYACSWCSSKHDPSHHVPGNVVLYLHASRSIRRTTSVHKNCAASLRLWLLAWAWTSNQNCPIPCISNWCYSYACSWTREKKESHWYDWPWSWSLAYINNRLPPLPGEWEIFKWGVVSEAEWLVSKRLESTERV